jgi:hypothetical protein
MSIPQTASDLTGKSQLAEFCDCRLQNANEREILWRFAQPELLDALPHHLRIWAAIGAWGGGGRRLDSVDQLKSEFALTISKQMGPVWPSGANALLSGSS